MTGGGEPGEEGLRRRALPEGLVRRRVTDEFSSDTVPAGLLRAHRVAEGVWGLLRLRAGTLRFVEEVEPPRSVVLQAGDSQVIEPGTPHRVEPAPDARFAVEFHG